MSVERFFHLPHILILQVEEHRLHHSRFLAKHLVEHPVADIRFGEEVFLEVKTIGLYLLACHGEGRGELPQQAVNGMDGYLPDTEETEHVVDAVSIKILGHLSEAFHPP